MGGDAVTAPGFPVVITDGDDKILEYRGQVEALNSQKKKGWNNCQKDSKGWNGSRRA